MVRVSDSLAGVFGLRKLLQYALNDPTYRVGTSVDLGTALLFLEIMKAASDEPQWFIHGKWAMIQAIEQRVETELSAIKERVRL